MNKKLKILIAEDDITSFILLKRMLTDASREILHAKTGTEAVSLSQNNPDIDVIFMDMRMPVQNGYDATEEIRKFNKEVIIISQTAFALSGDRDKALEAGCNDYISKPIDKADIMKLLDLYFGG